MIKKYDKLIKEAEEKVLNTPKLIKYSLKTLKKRKKAYIDKIEAEINSLLESGVPYTDKKIKSREDKITNVTIGNPTNKEQRAIFEKINLGSQKQMVDLLYISKYGLKLPIIKYTKDKFKKDTTTPSTAEDTLIELKDRKSVV